MSSDVRELLRRGAAEPTSAIDVGNLVRTSRRRRQRRVGVGLAFVVVLVAAAAGVMTVSEPSAEVAIQPRAPGDTVPAGWVEVDVRDAGIKLAMPPEWTRLDKLPGPMDENNGVTTSELVVVGTSGVDRMGPIGACTWNVPRAGGAWLSLYEFDGYRDGDELVLPYGETTTSIVDRPLDFRKIRGAEATCPSLPSAGDGPNSFRDDVFRDAGRLFLSRIIVSGGDPNAQGLALEVLNTLRVSPLRSDSASPTVATTTPSTLPAVPVTGGPGPAASVSDEEQIRAAFLGWINAQPKENVPEFVEDAEGIADAIRQGREQHSSDALAQYSGRVESVHVIDVTHADAFYTILFAGVPQYQNWHGRAVKINGRWMVTRETVCALLAQGGIVCPPRN